MTVVLSCMYMCTCAFACVYIMLSQLLVILPSSDTMIGMWDMIGASSHYNLF